MRVASLRLAWSVPDKSWVGAVDPTAAAKGLWAYVQEDSSAEAFLLALTSEGWSGHERFFVVAPEIGVERDSKELREEYYPGVPIRQDREVDGRVGFFECSKAKRLLGWLHRDA